MVRKKWYHLLFNIIENLFKYSIQDIFSSFLTEIEIENMYTRPITLILYTLKILLFFLHITKIELQIRKRLYEKNKLEKL